MINSLGLARSFSALRLAALVALGALLFPASAQAQRGKQQERERPAEVAPQFKPPPGMCRIWIDGVPGSRQPAPTDCATALRNRPANGRIVFGDDLPRGSSRPAQKGRGRPGK